MMRPCRTTLFALLLLPAAHAAARAADWVALLPGGGQYLLGEKGQALGWAGATAGMVGWGLAVHKGSSDEINAPLIYAQQIYVAGLYSAWRDLRLASRDPSYPPADPTPTWELARAPFEPSVLRSPWVYGAALAGGALNYVLARSDGGRRSYGDLRRFHYLGASLERPAGTAVYGAYWIPLSLGAGVAEEGLFRDMLQNGFERRWGPRRGPYAASGLFGLAHALPADSGSLGRVAFASAAGLYLGRLYQRDGYRLSEGVAAHFWWDAAAGLAAFFANPKDNGLGAKVDFAF